MEFNDPTFLAPDLNPREEAFTPFRRVGEVLRVRVTREPWLPWLQLHLPDETSEELEPEQARHWFRIRGANMDTVEKAFDYVWNFYGRQKPVWIEVKDPIEVSTPRKSSAEPQL